MQKARRSKYTKPWNDDGVSLLQTRRNSHTFRTKQTRKQQQNQHLPQPAGLKALVSQVATFQEHINRSNIITIIIINAFGVLLSLNRV